MRSSLASLETIPNASPPADRRRPALLLPALALNLLLSSGTFLVARRTLTEFPALPLSMLRFVLAAGALWPLTRWLQPNVRIRRQDRGRILLLGILAVPLNQCLFLVGMQWASASHAALLYALTPAFVLLFGLGADVRPGWLVLAGVALAFAGVLTLLLQRGLHFDPHSVRGDLVIFAAVIAWSLYLVLGRDVTRRYGPLVVTSEALLAGTLVFLPLGLWSLRDFHPGRISLPAWSGLFYLAWLTSGVNYVIWFWGLQYLKPASVALLTNLQPLVTVAMAWMFLGESLPAGFVVSTLLVLAGVWLSQHGVMRAARQRPAEPA